MTMSTRTATAANTCARHVSRSARTHSYRYKGKHRDEPSADTVLWRKLRLLLHDCIRCVTQASNESELLCALLHGASPAGQGRPCVPPGIESIKGVARVQVESAGTLSTSDRGPAQTDRDANERASASNCRQSLQFKGCLGYMVHRKLLYIPCNDSRPHRITVSTRDHDKQNDVCPANAQVVCTRARPCHC
jgi:hypothetical protein